MHDMNFGSGFGYHALGIGLPIVASLFMLVILWSLLWKGLALWRAARRGDWWWFAAFLVLNTAGILEIIYLFVVTGAKLSDFTRPTTHTQQH